jgi:hypothetical protein
LLPSAAAEGILIFQLAEPWTHERGRLKN